LLGTYVKVEFDWLETGMLVKGLAVVTTGLNMVLLLLEVGAYFFVGLLDLLSKNFLNFYGVFARS
jgi:hypothetical protein